MSDGAGCRAVPPGRLRLDSGTLGESAAYADCALSVGALEVTGVPSGSWRWLVLSYGATSDQNTSTSKSPVDGSGSP